MFDSTQIVAHSPEAIALGFKAPFEHLEWWSGFATFLAQPDVTVSVGEDGTIWLDRITL